MFGMSKKKRPALIEETVPPFQIGKTGNAAEFRAAHKRYEAKRDSHGYSCGGRSQQELHQGAVAGFLEGNIENLQTLLADAQAFDIIGRYSVSKVACEKLLLDLTQDSEQPAALLRLALDKVAEDKKQTYLDDILLKAVSSYREKKEFIATLLEAGADANCAVEGFKGAALVEAVRKEQPLPVVALLHAHGASFDDALFLMRARNHSQEEMRRLKFYREQVTGESATIEVAPDTMRQLLEQVKDLTEKVDTLKAARQSSKPPRKPAGKRPPSY